MAAAMDLDDFDFELPEELIALRPARPRDAARLLHVRADGALEDRHVRELSELLRADDVVVVNDTRVSPAALEGIRPPRDALSQPVKVDVNLLARDGPAAWTAFARPGRRLRLGDRIDFGDGVEAKIDTKDDSEVRLVFNRAGAALDAALAAVGRAPLPPYIARRRAADAQDLADYQTMFARDPGAVAAPTAGLHFTPELLVALEKKGVGVETVTLHVGPGTFAPLDVADLARGTLHAERAMLSPAAAVRLNAARDAGRRIVAVGTTSLRLLETAAATGRFAALDGETDLFIRPGYDFCGAGALMTNFHLPRSSLFMLVCAFAGTETMRRAYAHAVAARYRFYSYGDACLLELAR
jgi:S-adenosylmethionine:tRNA ribosyltransferase-isomerase